MMIMAGSINTTHAWGNFTTTQQKQHSLNLPTKFPKHCHNSNKHFEATAHHTQGPLLLIAHMKLHEYHQII